MDQVDDILRGVLAGRLTATDAQVALQPLCEPGVRGSMAISSYLERRSAKVEVKPSDVASVLRQYLDGSVSAQELSQWADFILHSEGFESPPGELQDEDYYEPMWYVLQQLSTPWIDGDITASSVVEHLNVLRQFDSSSAPEP